MPASQAGRRGFESHLPLQIFKDLEQELPASVTSITLIMPIRCWWQPSYGNFQLLLACLFQFADRFQSCGKVRLGVGCPARRLSHGTAGPRRSSDRSLSGVQGLFAFFFSAWKVTQPSPMSASLSRRFRRRNLSRDMNVLRSDGYTRASGLVSSKSSCHYWRLPKAGNRWASNRSVVVLSIESFHFLRRCGRKTF